MHSQTWHSAIKIPLPETMLKSDDCVFFDDPLTDQISRYVDMLFFDKRDKFSAIIVIFLSVLFLQQSPFPMFLKNISSYDHLCPASIK